MALGFAWLFPPAAGSELIYGILGVYLVYAVIVALRGRGQTGILGLLAIFGDTVYFLVMASSGSEKMLWLASFFFLFVLTETLVFYGTVEVLIIVVVSLVFCAVLPYSGVAIVRTVAATGALACALAVTKAKLSAEITALREKLVESEKTAEKSREAERVRIASDFHDGPLQSFISLQMRLEILRKLFERDNQAGMNDLKQLQQLA
ncbi:MAG: hypothetical protein KGN36_21690, partial [Acidobacteriota bacterium]|nr:hypothetical protein [Acidobacteriota bacterium]